MSTQPSKLIRAVTAFYRLVPQSLRFWWQLIRHGLVYGWLAAMTAGYDALQPPVPPQSDAAAAAAPQDRRPPLPGAGWSFAFTLAIGGLLVAVRRLAQAPHSAAWQLAVVALLALVLVGSAFLAALAFGSIRPDAAESPAFAALALLIRHPGTTLSLALSWTGCTILGYLNPLVAVLLAPGAYLWLTKSLLTRTAGGHAPLVAKP
ncbi:hypothetical protein [Lacticaseibacillus parakribbianus]|uniref:hypothetical protein n=1 Tax=Lacticaseibacillus parakribbianus TaxID=2970927 RepID=UPI0021CB3FD8|nr:hypothetical protein [Lacticaseibacillus parakribbianus]